MFGLLAGQFGMAFAAMLDFNTPETLTCAAAIAGVALAGYYALFRVPFTVALIAAAVYATVFGLTTLGGSFPETPRDIFLLSADGPFAVVTMALGLIGLIVAMSFDMSDPHRVTRRAASGFLAACDRGAGHREHHRADAVRRGHDPRADHACGLRRADGRRGGGDRPAVLPRLGRGLRGRACRHRGGRGRRSSSSSRWARALSSWVRNGRCCAAPSCATLPSFPGKTRLPPYDLLQKETPA
jgi:hypothetical protein